MKLTFDTHKLDSLDQSLVEYVSEHTHLSLSDWANKLGVSRQAVSNLGNGRSGDLTLSRLRRLVESLGGQIELNISFPDRITLSDVAQAVINDPDNFQTAIKQFYHSFAKTTDPGLVRDQPILTGHAEYDAYLAAVADRIATLYDFNAPSWVNDDERVLEDPWFCDAPEGMKIPLLQMSPPEFRARNIFVDDDRVKSALDKQKKEIA